MDVNFAYENSQQKQNVLAKFTWDTRETIGVGTYNRGSGKGIILEMPKDGVTDIEQTFFSLSRDGTSMEVDFIEVVKNSVDISDMIVYSALFKKVV